MPRPAPGQELQAIEDAVRQHPGGVTVQQIAGAIYNQTQSYALVFTGITISLLISTAMTALLIKPWAKLGTTPQMPITKPNH